jgi:hypothetical protein
VRFAVLLLAALILSGCGGGGTPTAEPTEIAETAVPTATEATREAAPTQTPAPTEVAASQETCPQPILAALTQVDLLCAATGRNQVCYGNTRLTVSPERNSRNPATWRISPTLRA